MGMIRTVGIIGAGTMGNGIAQACAAAGVDVVMIDVADAAVERGMATISGSLDRLVKKEKMTAADKAASLARIAGHRRLARSGTADLVIEAATENVDLKCKILSRSTRSRAGAVIASNTSSISITQLAALTSRPAGSSACISSIRWR